MMSQAMFKFMLMDLALAMELPMPRLALESFGKIINN